mmetsp:Transcript_21156/g.58827  ORF Transcript_21156/g.58827 Transcript_21156/m.58827 type:complete len:691 (+) Transcript_21156:212-2284(+)
MQPESSDNEQNNTPISVDNEMDTNMDEVVPHPSRNSRNVSMSSFLELNQDSDKIIPQLTVSVNDISYNPVTATTSGGASTSWLSLKRNRSPRKRSRTLVLDRIRTEIHPFQLTAWMGPSGSGKTSLTSVVANQVNFSGDISHGSITVKNQGNEGKGLARIPKQMVGVVWQDDLLLGNLTVEETIYFAARLKMPAHVEVRSLVEEAMKELGLLHVRDHMIASISGGERKRVSLAQEIVVRPSLLVCDEPTSGLDATTALSLVKTLKGLVSLGHSVVLVIHQPRTDIFNLLDRLLLLSKGRVVYDGHPKRVRSYLEDTAGKIPLPPETGIADWIMDTIIGDEKLQQSSEGHVSLADHWVAHRERMQGNLRPNHDSSLANIVPSQSNHLPQGVSKYEASFWTQLSMLLSRISKQQRGERLTRVSFMLTLTYILFTGFMYFRLPDNTANIFERNSLLFFLLIAQGLGIVTSCIGVFHRERALLRRERAKKLYRVLPYFFAKIVSDSTLSILMPMVYGIVTYWTAGLRPTVAAFLKCMLAFYLTLSCSQSMGFFLSLSCSTNTLAEAMIVAPPITLFMYLLAGFYIPIRNMHVALLYVSYLSFARYGYTAMLINEYEGRGIPCVAQNETGNANDPATGITLGALDASECPLPGEAVYKSMGVEGIFANYWFNIGIVALFQVVFLVGTYALLRRSK